MVVTYFVSTNYGPTFLNLKTNNARKQFFSGQLQKTTFNT